jgi:hypothetical protein
LDVWENKDGSVIAINIGKRSRMAYIILMFDKITKTMELESFSTDRIVPGHIHTDVRISELFVDIVHDVCRRKGAKHLALQDNSMLVCKTNNRKLKLADMYFLAHGKTWYESKFTGLQPDLEIDKYRKKVTENTWDDITERMRSAYPDDYEVIKAYFTTLEPFPFPTNEKGSAMRVFEIMKDVRMCEPFTLWMDNFIIASQIPSLYTSTWHLDF